MEATLVLTLNPIACPSLLRRGRVRPSASIDRQPPWAVERGVHGHPQIRVTLRAASRTTAEKLVARPKVRQPSVPKRALATRSAPHPLRIAALAAKQHRGRHMKSLNFPGLPRVLVIDDEEGIRE